MISRITGIYNIFLTTIKEILSERTNRNIYLSPPTTLFTVSFTLGNWHRFNPPFSESSIN